MTRKVAGLLLILSLVVVGYSLSLLHYLRQIENETAENLTREVYELVADLPQLGRLVSQVQLDDLAQLRVSRELVDPYSVLPLLSPEDELLLGPIENYAKECDDSVSLDGLSPSLNKYWTWVRFGCGKIDSLGASFFSQSPYMTPWGVSYVFQVHKSKIRDRVGLPENFKKFSHLLEAKDLQNWGIELSALERLVADLWPGQLVAMEDGELLAWGPKLAGLKLGEKEYGFFKSQDVLELFVGARLEMVPSGTKECIALGSICLQRDQGILKEEIYRLEWTFRMALVLAALTLILYLVQRLVIGSRIRKERMLVMHTLTHEMRTPATSLNLSLEKMRQQFDNLDEDSQVELLRMIEEVQRLQKVIYASKDYLKSEHEQSPLNIKPVLVPSINDVIDECLLDYQNQIQVTLLVDDESWKVDPYWLSLCVANLTKNALNHGQPPVEVTLGSKSGHGFIHIQDGGQDSALSLDSLTTPFKKGESSQGMGLGVSIVQRVIKAMGGKLTLTTCPTRFTIELPNIVNSEDSQE